MSLNLVSKKAVIDEVSDILTSAQTLVIAEYAGVTVDKMTSIRVKARQSNVYLHVIKNTLVRKAVSNTKFAALADKMVGQLIYSISTDPVSAAKIINEFAKDNDKIKIIGGMYNDNLLSNVEVQQLAMIPSRDELLSMIMRVMLQIPEKFVRCIAAIRDQKEQMEQLEQVA